MLNVVLSSRVCYDQPTEVLLPIWEGLHYSASLENIAKEGKSEKKKKKKNG